VCSSGTVRAKSQLIEFDMEKSAAEHRSFVDASAAHSLRLFLPAESQERSAVAESGDEGLEQLRAQWELEQAVGMRDQNLGFTVEQLLDAFSGENLRKVGSSSDDENETDDEDDEVDDEDPEATCYPNVVYFLRDGQEIGRLEREEPEQIVLTIDGNSESVDIEWTFYSVSQKEKKAELVACLSLPVRDIIPKFQTQPSTNEGVDSVMLTLYLREKLGADSFLAQDMDPETPNEFIKVRDWTENDVGSTCDAIVCIGGSSAMTHFGMAMVRCFPDEFSEYLLEKEQQPRVPEDVRKMEEMDDQEDDEEEKEIFRTLENLEPLPIGEEEFLVNMLSDKLNMDGDEAQSHLVQDKDDELILAVLTDNLSRVRVNSLDLSGNLSDLDVESIFEG